MIFWPWPILAEQASADTWMDIAARIVDASPALMTAAAGAAVAIRIAQKGATRHEETARTVAEQSKTIREIRESTVNSHDRPMRYDIDDLAAAVTTVTALTKTLGSEIREDRLARRSGDDRLQENDRKMWGLLQEFGRQLNVLAAQLDELAARQDRQDRIAEKHHPDEP
ncbi:hypothetical protein [Gordonia sp. (in: high G+C Gram-positive bacteria)]|uniref:hypothetical protein n=1 Tax=Gordonia sp. (in: high G+C Gram-positive bacteria) TaxID=84139 RepID=UPI003C76EB63